MKQITYIFYRVTLLLLISGFAAACSVGPGTTSGGVAGIGQADATVQEKHTATVHVPSNNASLHDNGSQGEAEPLTTSSVVPMPDEGHVVDLPHAGFRAKPSATAVDRTSGEQVSEVNEDDLSPDERHRRELINRGDLQEGDPLPPQ